MAIDPKLRIILPGEHPRGFPDRLENYAILCPESSLVHGYHLYPAFPRVDLSGRDRLVHE
jgi:hypothetical protein